MSKSRDYSRTAEAKHETNRREIIRRSKAAECANVSRNLKGMAR